MPLTAAPRRAALLLVRRCDIIVNRAPAPPRHRRAKRTLAAFVLAVLFVNFGLSLGMDTVAPTLRDPEYGRKLSRLRADPRPAIVVLGSSRAAMGFRPECAGEGTRLFNFAQVGSGPVMMVMTLRRLLADGAKPSAIVLEYWPAFLREDGPYCEEVRIDKHRLRAVDVPFVRDYFEHADATEATMRDIRVLPWSSHRLRLMSQAFPGWLRWDRRMDAAWQKMDADGWLPGLELDPSPEDRVLRHEFAAQYYRPLFAAFRVDPLADRALRELVMLCRTHGIPVAFTWLPESSEFAEWLPPEAACEGECYLEALRGELGVPLIDARGWLADRHIADGFHPTQPGAAELSRRLGPAIRKTFASRP